MAAMVKLQSQLLGFPDRLGDLDENSSEDEDLWLDNKIWGVYVKAMLSLCSKLFTDL